MDNLIPKQLSDCDTLLDTSKHIFSAESSDLGDEEVAKKRVALRRASISLVAMKNRNREIFLSLEKKRGEVESYKDRVDRLQLDLENLLYKQAYLLREIRTCKDFSTPQLNEVESALGLSIGATAYREDLDEVHTQSIDEMVAEIGRRLQMQEALRQLDARSQAVSDRLEKKRKFLDELPTRVALVKTSTTDLNAQFSSCLEEAPAVSL